MNSKLLYVSAVCLTLIGCGPSINYDPDYIWSELQKCNQQPLLAVDAECKIEKEKGLEHKPACESLASIRARKSNEDLAAYFDPSLKKKNQCTLSQPPVKEGQAQDKSPSTKQASQAKPVSEANPVNDGHQSNHQQQKITTANKRPETSDYESKQSQGSEAAIDHIDIKGTWVGNYACQGQQLGLSLFIKEQDSHDHLKATFFFYPLDSNPNTAKGCYAMQGYYIGKNGVVKLTGDHWLKRPEGYSMIGLSGIVSKNQISGEILDNRCETFSVEKAASPPSLPETCHE